MVPTFCYWQLSISTNNFSNDKPVPPINSSALILLEFFNVSVERDDRSRQAVQLASWSLGIDIVITILHAEHLAHQTGPARKE